MKRNRIASAVLCIGVLSGSVHAAQPCASNDDFRTLPSISRGRGGDVIRSADTVAWVEERCGVENIHAARPPSYHPIRLTQYAEDDGTAIRLVGFASRGDKVIFVRGQSAYTSARFNPAHLPEPPETALFAVSLTGGRPHRFAKGPVERASVSPDGRFVAAAGGNEVWAYEAAHVQAPPRHWFTVRGSIAGLVFSPDASMLAFVTDLSAVRRGRYGFVGTFDVRSARVRYLAPAFGMDRHPVWSPDGSRVAFLRSGNEPKSYRFSDEREGPPFSVVVADARTGEGGPVWTAPLGIGSVLWEIGGATLSWMADDTLVFPYEGSGWNLLHGVSAGGGAERLLTPGHFEVQGAELSPDRRVLMFWANSQTDLARFDLYRLSTATSLEPERVPGGDTPDGLRRNALPMDGGGFAYLHAGLEVPERLMLRSRTGQEIQLSTGPRPGDPISRFARPGETVTFRSLDGLPVPAILYRPRLVRPEGGHPVLVTVHGGSRAQSLPRWYPGLDHLPITLDFLVEQGWFVLAVNYRSGTGYGLDFRNPGSYGGRGAGDVQDIAAAARYLRETVPQIDPKKIVVYGHSYGGHLVTNVLARYDDFAAGIDLAGVGDWVVEMEKDEGEPLPFHLAQRGELESLAFESSAISKIDDWGREPLLLIHGDDDVQAAMQQSMELFFALQRRGRPVEAIVLPGEGHFLELYANQLRFIRGIEAFLRAHDLWLSPAPGRS